MKINIKKSLTGSLFYFSTLALTGCNATGINKMYKIEDTPLRNKITNLSLGNKSESLVSIARGKMITQFTNLKTTAQKTIRAFHKLKVTSCLYKTPTNALNEARKAVHKLIADYDGAYALIADYDTAYLNDSDRAERAAPCKKTTDPYTPYPVQDIYTAALEIDSDPNYKRIFCPKAFHNNFASHDTETSHAVAFEMLVVALIAHLTVILAADINFNTTGTFCRYYNDKLSDTNKRVMQAINYAQTVQTISSDDADRMRYDVQNTNYMDLLGLTHIWLVKQTTE